MSIGRQRDSIFFMEERETLRKVQLGLPFARARGAAVRLTVSRPPWRAGGYADSRWHGCRPRCAASASVRWPCSPQRPCRRPVWSGIG